MFDTWLLSGRYLRFEKTQVEPWEKTARPIIHYYLCYLLMKGCDVTQSGGEVAA